MNIREQIERAKKADLLTVKEVALLTRYTPFTIYRKVWKNEIPGVVRLGKGVRFSRPVLMAWARVNLSDRNILTPQ